MLKFKGKSYPIRRGMVIRYREVNGAYREVRVIEEEYCGKNRTHCFTVQNTKTSKITEMFAQQLYNSAEIISLGTITYWDDLKLVKIKK